jgi:hypothetical protein
VVASPDALRCRVTVPVERAAIPPAGTDGGPLGEPDDDRRRITRRPTRVSLPFPLGVSAGTAFGAFEAVRAGRRGR